MFSYQDPYCCVSFVVVYDSLLIFIMNPEVQRTYAYVTAAKSESNKPLNWTFD